MEQIDDLIIKYQFLVEAELRRLNIYDEERRADYRQIGLIGLWKAISTYQKTKNDNFEAYAYYVIKNTILKEMKKEITQKRKLDKIASSLDTNIGDTELTLHDVIGAEDEHIDMQKLKEDIDKPFIKVVINSKNLDQLSKKTGLSRYKLNKKLKLEKDKIKKHIF